MRQKPRADKIRIGGRIRQNAQIEGAADVSTPAVSASAVLSATRADITLSDGRCVLIEGNTDLSAVVTLVRGLSA